MYYYLVQILTAAETGGLLLSLWTLLTASGSAYVFKNRNRLFAFFAGMTVISANILLILSVMTERIIEYHFPGEVFALLVDFLAAVFVITVMISVLTKSKNRMTERDTSENTIPAGQLIVRRKSVFLHILDTAGFLAGVLFVLSFLLMNHDTLVLYISLPYSDGYPPAALMGTSVGTMLFKYTCSMSGGSEGNVVIMVLNGVLWIMFVASMFSMFGAVSDCISYYFNLYCRFAV
jgi:hypothetical protein